MSRIPPLVIRIFIPLLMVLGLIGIALWRGTGRSRPDGPPPPILAQNQLLARARLLPLSASEVASVPLAGHWEMPMGTRGGAFVYNAQPFMEANPKRGGFHLGDDLNGIGQENTDLNDPVFAPADGLVAYAGEPSSGWGGVVILLHRTDLGLRQSFFGHLAPGSLSVVPGENVPRGRFLGRLALTGAVDFAHLHFEIRRGAVVDPGPGYAAEGARSSEDPVGFVSRRLGPVGLPVASALARQGGFRVQGQDTKPGQSEGTPPQGESPGQ